MKYLGKSAAVVTNNNGPNQHNRHNIMVSDNDPDLNRIMQKMQTKNANLTGQRRKIIHGRISKHGKATHSTPLPNNNINKLTQLNARVSKLEKILDNCADSNMCQPAIINKVTGLHTATKPSNNPNNECDDADFDITSIDSDHSTESDALINLRLEFDKYKAESIKTVDRLRTVIKKKDEQIASECHHKSL